MNNRRTQTGFTLIEVIIAVGIFAILMVLGIGAVLNANEARRKAQTQRAVNDTLSFIMEDMSRNIRLGVDYRCGDINTVQETEEPQDCTGGDVAVAFEAPYLAAVGQGSGRSVGYSFRNAGNGRAVLYKLERASSDSSWQEFNITPPEVTFDPSASGFRVIGSSPEDQLQPRVRVYLSGEVDLPDQDITSPFTISTTLSQRLIDR